MRQRLRTGLLAIMALAASHAAVAQGVVPPAGGPAAKAALPPPKPAILSQVLATVNGQPITREELVDFLSRYGVAPGADEKEQYRVGIEYIANNKLISQFLVRNRVPVTEAEMAAEIARVDAQMKQSDGRDLKTALAERGSTMDDLRNQIRPYLGWKKYVDGVATDAELKKYVEANKDVFSRVQVRASHLFLAVAPEASASVKEATRQKLLGIKAEIDSGKITFPDAANKFSEDDANKQSPNGGDLGYFTRKGPFLEKFVAAAFALKPGVTSNPIETEYGWHLIKVTDRKPGQPFDFEQNRAAVLSQFAADTQERIIAEERKTAKIDIKPMPADLFPPVPTTPAGAGAAPAGAPATKGAASPGAPR